MYPYKGIVFDIDGTLVNNEFAVLQSLADTIAKFQGKEIPREELTFCLGIPGHVTAERLGLEPQEEALYFWAMRMLEYSKPITLFPGIAETVEALSRKGYTLGIVTSRVRAQQELDFDGLSIRPCFDHVICADDAARPKPFPDPLELFMKKAGLTPQEVLYIGDSPYDSQCAASAGTDFCLALWGAHDTSVPSQVRFSRPGDLLAYITGGSSL